MKGTIFAAVACMIIATSVAAQSQNSARPLDARFEIVKTPWDKLTTFRLDRYRGVIDRLGTCAKDDSVGSSKCWREMIVIDAPRANTTRPHFQIVFDEVEKLTLLLDTDSGVTWQYALDATQNWHPFVDCADKTNAQCVWRPLP